MGRAVERFISNIHSVNFTIKNSLIKIMPLDEHTIGFIVIHTSCKEQMQQKKRKKKWEKKEKSVTLRGRKKY